MKLEAIALDYIKRYRARARAEMRRYAALRSLPEAIREAALCCLPDGKRHPHQYRIPGNVLVRTEMALQALAADIATSENFDDLHSVVWAAIKPIRGVGELATYDIAHRIGAYLRLKPELVYLHRGTRDGAKASSIFVRTMSFRT